MIKYIAFREGRSVAGLEPSSSPLSFSIAILCRFGRLTLLRGTSVCFRQSLHFVLLCVCVCVRTGTGVCLADLLVVIVLIYIHIYMRVHILVLVVISFCCVVDCDSRVLKFL